ncbi:MAG: amidohydrolase family protein [Pseudomonadota bacterium]
MTIQRTFFYRLALSAVCLCALLWLGTASASQFVFDGVQLIDIEAGTVSEPQRLAVSNGQIVASDDASASRRPFRYIDARGLFLMPGLTEMHAHVPNTQNMQQVEDVLTLFLAHGITTVRGMLGEPGHLRLQNELAMGLLAGPRLITSGPSLNGQSVTSPEQAEALVRRQHEAGYDFLKLHPGLWPETFDAITTAADELNMTYAGHVSDAVGLERVLASRQTTIDHLDGYAQMLVPPNSEAANQPPGFFGMAIAAAMDETRIEPWATRTALAGTWNVPTQTLVENIAITPIDDMMERPAMRWIGLETKQQWQQQINQMRSQFSREDLERFIDVRRALIAALHQAGAGLLLGADAPQIMNVPGDSTHHELRLMVAAGLSTREALAMGTTAVADFFDDDFMACLNPGCAADLVLLSLNPLEDIEHTRSVVGVMQAGRWYDRPELDRKLNDIERRVNPTGPD